MLINGFYKIVSKEDVNGSLVAKVLLNKDHEIYKAHFPGNPITPGVCIIEVLKTIVAQEYKKELMFNKVSNIKFLKVISPIENPEIEYHIKHLTVDLGIKVNVVVKKEDAVFTKISGYFNEV